MTALEQYWVQICRDYRNSLSVQRGTLRSRHLAIEQHIRRGGSVSTQLTFELLFMQHRDDVIIAVEPHWLRIWSIRTATGIQCSTWHGPVSCRGTNVWYVVAGRQGHTAVADHCIQLIPTQSHVLAITIIVIITHVKQGEYRTLKVVFYDFSMTNRAVIEQCRLSHAFYQMRLKGVGKLLTIR